MMINVTPTDHFDTTACFATANFDADTDVSNILLPLGLHTLLHIMPVAVNNLYIVYA